MYISKPMTLCEAVAARMMGFHTKYEDGQFWAIDHIHRVKVDPIRVQEMRAERDK